MKMNRMKNLLVATLLLLLNKDLPLFCQIKTADSLQNQFINYQLHHLQEKIYIHTDKNFYLPNELCWFKIYLVDAFFNKPSNISKIAYLELLDNRNKVVFQTKIAINNGLDQGSFQIPSSLSTGTYTLIAYTNWMKNFNSELYFSKPISVLNPQNYKYPIVEKNQNQFDIHFFPEGGNLVKGIESKIAFKITDNLGLGQNATTLIVNNLGDTLAKSSTVKFGIGSFSFTPKNDENYKAITIVNNTVKLEKELPKALASGLVMNLDSKNKNQIEIKIGASAEFEDQSIMLLVHSKGVLKGIFNAEIENKAALILINKEFLSEGISQFVLFDGNQKTWAERLFFKFPENDIDLELKSDKENYGTREKVNISIKNKLEKKIVANLSMAVYLVDSLQGPSEFDIKNYLLLTSDLKGEIESPNYYLNKNEPSLAEVTDNLMLINAWRRFNWSDILKNYSENAKFLPEIAGHIVQAKITNSLSGVPIKNAHAFLTIPGERLQFYQSISDENGILTFETKDFYNPNEIIIQSELKDSTYSIEMLSAFSTKNELQPPITTSSVHQNLNLIYNHNKYLQIESAFPSIKQYNIPKIDSSKFYGKPDETYLLDNFTRFTTLEEVLREYVLSVGVKQRNNNYQLQVLNKLSVGFFVEPPLVLLDGLPIFDINKFMKIDPLKLKKLEVVSRKYYLGNIEFNGIVNFTSYDGNLAGYELEKNTTVFDYEGAQISRQFYSPKYDNKEKIESRQPDFRQLLYWDPNIKLMENNEVTLNFFSSDIEGKYAIIVQGLAQDGSLVSEIRYFNVLKQK